MEGEQRGCSSCSEPAGEGKAPAPLPVLARGSAHTKAVAPFVASVNRLALSLAASRHLPLQPGTEQMPVWSGGGRETPAAPIFHFSTHGPSQLAAAAPRQPQCSESSAPPASPALLLHCPCSAPPGPACSSSPFPLTRILHTQIPESFGHAVLSAGTV